MKKDILISVAGIGGGQFFVLISTPILAKIYSPEEFGEYATLLAASGVVATIASLRLETAIPAARDEDVKPLFHSALILPVIICTVVACVLKILSINFDSIEKILQENTLWVVSVAIFLGGVNVFQALLTRCGNFKLSAFVKLLQPLLFIGCAILLFDGLSSALLLSWFFVFCFLFFKLRKIIFGINLNKSLRAARKFKKYPLISAPMALLDTASLALPLLFISATFGNDDAGNYSQVQRLLAAPLILVGLAATQVFYKYAGDLYRQNMSMKPLVWRTFLSLLAFASILLLGTWIFGDLLMAFLLGNGWRVDTNFLLLAILPVIFRMVVSPVSSLFLITNRLGVLGCWQAAYFCVTVSVIFSISGRLDFDNYLLVLAVSEFIMYFVYFSLAIFIATDSKR